MTARSRYDALQSFRSQYLDTAVTCAELTLPYLIHQEDTSGKYAKRVLQTPWQSIGAKGVTTLASKLMLALLPPQTSFFKLQLRDTVDQTQIPIEAKAEVDATFAKMERIVNDSIAASNDRVKVHEAVKHLVVTGNAGIYMGPDALKVYPLNRYVVDRDGSDNVVEAVTKERMSRKILQQTLESQGRPQKSLIPQTPEGPQSSGTNGIDEEVDVYTHIRRTTNGWEWHQEADDRKIPGTRGTAPLTASPWLFLRFNSVDGEMYGRGRVEEFLGDLKSLEGLMQAIVEGSAAAAKIIFLVNPGSITKVASIANAANGDILSGRAEDVTVIQAGKAQDFRTASEMIATLERRLSEAFLVMNVRQSERTTAEEVRMTQLELEQQLGGLFSLLTVEFLIPYLNRKLLVAQRAGEILKLDKKIMRPTIVAGINALGRGQDRDALILFTQTVTQTLGPEAVQRFVNPTELIRRMATSQGIDTLSLIKTQQELEAEQQRAMQQQKEMSLVNQTAQMAKAPIYDPTKNPDALDLLGQQQQQDEGQPPPEGGQPTAPAPAPGV